MKYSVVIGDDHQLVRAGFAALVRQLDEFELIGEAGTGWDVIDRVRTHRPDLLLLDINMPELNGLDVLDVLAGLDLPTKTIVISIHDEPEFVRRALRRGASGYLLKDCAAVDFELALKAVARGQVYLHPAIAGHLLHGGEAGDAEPSNPLDQLTCRQRQVLQLIAEGFRTREIAERLSLSVKTVETHRSNLSQRLGVGDVSGLVRLALKHGLVGDLRD